MSLAWYVVQVATNMEDRVQAAITHSISKKIESYVDTKELDKAALLRDAFAIDHSLNTGLELEEFLKTNVILVPKEKIEEIKKNKGGGI